MHLFTTVISEVAAKMSGGAKRARGANFTSKEIRKLLDLSPPVRNYHMGVGNSPL